MGFVYVETSSGTLSFISSRVVFVCGLIEEGRVSAVGEGNLKWDLLWQESLPSCTARRSHPLEQSCDVWLADYGDARLELSRSVSGL